MKSQLVDQVKLGNLLGEGVLWNHYLNEFQWTDIQERKLYRYELTGRLIELELPERLCSFGLSKHKDWVIAAFESGFGWLNIITGSVHWLHRPELGETGRRFNDGRVDRIGNFWCGTMVEDTEKSKTVYGSIFCLTPQNQLLNFGGKVEIFNALCWSPDGRHMYYGDSAQSIIWRSGFPLDENHVVGRKKFVKLPTDVAPDGADVDTSGRLWNAEWGGNRVVCYGRDGQQYSEIEVGARQPTCLAFGGAEYQYLAVTSAKIGLDTAISENSGEGDLFIYKVDAKGLSAPIFKLDVPCQ